MTTFVLHGGETSRQSPQNDKFFELFTSLVRKDVVKILMCYWARESKDWERLFERDLQKVRAQTTKQVDALIVKSTQELLDRISEYDVLYVAGGDAEPIEAHIPELSNLKSILEGKVYIGSSMGAFIASKNYCLSFDSQDSTTVHTGLSLIPVNTLCHWDKEPNKETKLGLLESLNDSTPIVTLNECEYTQFYF